MEKSRFNGIFELQKERRKMLLTKNLTPGKTVYGEKTITENSIEYREWDPKRSKLCSAVLKGIRETGIKEGDVVLYLGAASGTTASHVSDIVGKDGFVFALDFAPRVVRNLVYVCEERKNMAPLLEDANRPENYRDKIIKVDVVYQDIAQKNQIDIFLKNVNLFLKNKGYCLIAVKARSIDVTRNPMKIFEEVKNQLKGKLTIIDYRTLEPFQKDHCFFVLKKQNN